MEREEGFYWVICQGRTQVAEWDGLGWFICGFEAPRTDIKVLRRIPEPQ
jgi:hypothetical protein